jgi:hypothetical protein
MNLAKYANPLNYLRYASNRLYHSPLNRSRERIESHMIGWQAANARIAHLITAAQPALVCRLGWGETNICWNYVRRSFWPVPRLSVYNADLMKSATFAAGIAAPDSRSLDRFASIYLASFPFVDIFGMHIMGMRGVKGMNRLVDRLSDPSVTFTQLPYLEPWAAHAAGAQPWTQALAGKTVLVVHPFVSSIHAQYERRCKIKTVCDILADFTLTNIKPPVTFAGSADASSWERNLQGLMGKVAREPFDVALIGCGAYGLPLGAFVKQLGRIAIHLGGATQMLFGIRGNRWDQRPDFVRLMDDSWVRPLESERPPGADQVEQACYW